MTKNQRAYEGELTPAQLKLLARMIRDGQAVLVERNGKIEPVSKI